MKNKNKIFKESTIGKIIYGFLLFMPLIAIGFTCLISTFNMSSKQESKIIYKYETNEVISNSDLIVGNIYHVIYEPHNANTQILKCDAIYNVHCKRYDRPTILNYDLFGNIIISAIENESTLRIIDYNGYTIGNISFVDSWEFDVVYNEVLDTTYTTYSKCDLENIPIESVETHNVESQDIFYYAIEKTEQSDLFNWSKDSIIYTGIHNTTEQLSISNTFIPMLLAYWLIISVIYILYDIILMMLVIFHRKVHCLQDSI